MTEPKTRSARAKVPYTLETAREEILAKLAKAGAKGTASIVTAATKEPKRSLLEQARATLEAEARIYVDRSGKKPKYFSDKYAPTVEGVAAKIEQFAARRHPELLTVAELMKAVAANEKGLASKAFEIMEADRRLVRLIRKTSAVFAHGKSLRAMLGVAGAMQVNEPVAGDEISGKTIHGAYEDLVRLTGFPDVGIAALQRHTGVSMDALKNWLLEERQNGRAVFGFGDWSLADAETRAGLIELRGQRYLFVRLRGES